MWSICLGEGIGAPSNRMKRWIGKVDWMAFGAQDLVLFLRDLPQEIGRHESLGLQAKNGGGDIFEAGARNRIRVSSTQSRGVDLNDCKSKGVIRMRKVAILQSNYITWKGYFDLIAAGDEFILYDDKQYTRLLSSGGDFSTE
ncbi:WbqC family protein [Pseudomonas sp. O230]|uniref:WbqC family protein n=1 Tax=Pseudomonas sp. O230 TaxID=3159450 RepID=UPI00387AC7A8